MACGSKGFVSRHLKNFTFREEKELEIKHKDIVAYKATCTDPFVREVLRRFLGAHNANQRQAKRLLSLQEAIKAHKRKHFGEAYAAQLTEANIELWSMVNDDLGPKAGGA